MTNEKKRTPNRFDTEEMKADFRGRCVEERQRVRRGEPPTMEAQNWHGKNPKTGMWSKTQGAKDHDQFADGYEDIHPTDNLEYESVERHPPYGGAWQGDIECPRFVVCFRDKEGKPHWNGLGEETFEEAWSAALDETNEGCTEIKRIECRGHMWPNPSGYGDKVEANRDRALGFYAAGHADDLPCEEGILDVRKIELGLRGHFTDVVEKMLLAHSLTREDGAETEHYKDVVKLLKSVAEDDGLPAEHSARKWASEKLDEYEKFYFQKK